MQKRKEGGPSSSHHIKGARLESRPDSTSTFISKVASFYSLKILSTKEGQRGILKWLSLTPSTIR